MSKPQTKTHTKTEGDVGKVNDAPNSYPPHPFMSFNNPNIQYMNSLLECLDAELDSELDSSAGPTIGFSRKHCEGFFRKIL